MSWNRIILSTKIMYFRYMKTGFKWLGLILAVGVISVGDAWAQSGSGDLSGTVTDTGGAVVVGARVTARSQTALGVEVRTETAEGGSYALTSLRPGVYSVRIEGAGFATIDRAGVTVRTGVRTRLDVQLHAGSSDQVVNVTADASPLLSESGALVPTTTKRLDSGDGYGV